MKQAMYLGILITFCVFSCKQNQEKAEKQPSTLQKTVDSVEIKETITGFFSWYEKNESEVNKIDFVDETGEHLLINEEKLNQYLKKLYASGYLSQQLLENERKFYAACAKEWAKATKDEIPLGLSSDRFYCAQDFIAPYSSGEVKSFVEDNQASAVLILKGELGEMSIFSFELVKENAGWRISKLGCDMGVQY